MLPQAGRGFPESRIAADPDARRVGPAEDAAMSYAIVWRENEGEAFAGRLALAADCVVLSGATAGARESERRLGYEDLADVRLERRDRPLLVLLGPGGNRVEITSLDGAGALHELAEQLAVVSGKAAW